MSVDWSYLSRGQRLSLTYTYVRSGLAEGRSVNTLYREMVSKGMGIRRQDFLAIAREAQGIEQATGSFRGLRREYRMSEGRIPVSRFFIPESYRYTVRLNTFNPTTKQRGERWVYVDSPVNLTRGEVEDIAVEIAEPMLGSWQEEIAAGVITGIRRKG